MNLPHLELITIPQRKITEYLLSPTHPEGSTKAMIEELDRVILTEDLPSHKLKAGDIGTVVLVHTVGAGYEVEFVALNGDTVAVVSVAATQVRPAVSREIPHARLVA